MFEPPLEIAQVKPPEEPDRESGRFSKENWQLKQGMSTAIPG